MVVKYKRKFKVPGDTIQECWDFRKKCEKQYGYDPDKRPCIVKQPTTRKSYTGGYWIPRPEESRCPFPINKPKEYIVSEMEDGTWRCSCPVWKFKRRQCHHIDKAQNNPEEYEIAVEFTGKTTEVFDKLFKT